MVELDYLDELINTILEAKKTTVGKHTKKAKIARATGSLAAGAAKKANDPLYKKMIYHRDLYRKYKEQLMKKYAPRVRSKARR